MNRIVGCSLFLLAVLACSTAPAAILGNTQLKIDLTNAEEYELGTDPQDSSDPINDVFVDPIGSH